MLLMQQQELSDGVNNDFVFTVKSDNAGTSASNQFTIPTGGIGGIWLYDISTSDGYTASGITGNHTITFPSGAGTHTVTITGQFSRIYFNNGGDKLKILSVINWGNVGWSNNQQSVFWGCTNLTSIPLDQVWVFNTVTVISSMFRECRLNALPTDATLASVTNAGFGAFRNCNLTSLPSGMLLSSLTSQSDMFYGNDLTSLPSGMTLNSLTTGGYMFYNNDLTSLPSGMNLTSLTDGTAMFWLNPITSLPSGMTLSTLITGASMFRQTSITDLPSGMTLSAITSGIFMFASCTINKARYSQLLVDMEDLNPNNSVSFHGGNSKYNTAGQTARNILTSSPRNWTIIDGGFEA